MAGDSSDGVAVMVGNSTGLNKIVMKTLPIIVYTSPSKLALCLGTNCPICLAEFVEGEKKVQVQLLRPSNQKKQSTLSVIVVWHPVCIMLCRHFVLKAWFEIFRGYAEE